MSVAVGEIEIGKGGTSFEMIDDGIEELEEAKSRWSQINLDVGQIERILCLSNKLRALKQLDQETSIDEEAFKILKKPLSTLKKLRIVMRNKIDKSQPQIDITKLLKSVDKILKDD